jgi:hypothetical protein
VRLVALARVLGLLVVGGTLVCSRAAASGPADALIQAVQRSNEARSSNVVLTERVKLGARILTTLRMSGIQEPRAKEGLFLYHVSPAKAGLGDATIVLVGSAVYLHYPLFDTLRTTNPAVKRWLMVNTRSSLGVDPTGLASLGVEEVREMTGLAVVGTGTDGGVPVTRYRGKLALSKIARSSQIQNLFASLPSEVSALLKGTENLEISVGRDGYIHHLTSVITAPLGGQTPLSITIDAELTNFDRSTTPIVVPPASQVMTAAQFQQVTGSGSSAADSALLQKVVLRASQVGAGFKLSQIPGGKLVQGEVTLDFCNLSYPSESLRSARLQVVYTAKAGQPGASNEIVTYRSGGAQQALREVKRASTTCPNGPVANAPSGVKDLVRQSRVVSDPHLLPGSIAILETDSAVVKGKHVTEYSMAVYQVRGNVLSGVYGHGTSVAVVEKLTLHAAQQSAANLRKHISAATQSGSPAA